MYATPVNRASILIVDDEEIVRESLRLALKNDHHLHMADSARQALNCFQQHVIDLVFLDIRLPDMNGIELLKNLKQIAPATRVVMLTAVQKIDIAVDAIKTGAFDFLAKPIDIDRVRTLAQQAAGRKEARIQTNGYHFRATMTDPEDPMRRIYKIIDAIAPCEGHALIQGANSREKKRIARALHNRSPRAAGPYVAINCATRQVARLERHLYGPGRGVYNPELIDSRGKIEIAHKGSLFLDNINYLSLDIQDRLLQLIQHKECHPLGAHRPIRADVRIIAATNQNLRRLVEARLFKADLFYRLKAIPIDLPLLYERGADIGLLLEHCLQQIALRNGAMDQRFAAQDRSRMKTGDWPGNVREFEHLIERLCRRTKRHQHCATDLPGQPAQDHPYTLNGLKLKKATRAFERQYILTALKAANGSRSQAARRLGIHRNTLRLKTKELGIDFR